MKTTKRRQILTLGTLIALLLITNVSMILPVAADTGTIIAHRDISGVAGKTVVTTYVYQDTDETVPDKDFYAFKLRVHATSDYMSELLVSIYSPQGICDLWEPKDGWYFGGSVSFSWHGISFSIPLPWAKIDVSGEYTNKIEWKMAFWGPWPVYMVYDVDLAAAFWTPQGSGLDWTINVQAGRMELPGPHAVWIDRATWSTAAEQKMSRVGYLSGSGATYTFSISDLYGTYTVGMVANEIADFDLYAKWNSAPTTSSYDQRGFSGYSSEYFWLTGGGQGVSNKGTLYVMVRSWSGSGYWKCNVVAGSPTVNGGRKYGTLSGTGATATYSLTGSGRAWVYLAGSDGSDFDLYLKWNSPPTTSSYDAIGFSGYSHEIVTAKDSGTLYYMVRSWMGSGQYTVIALIF